MTAALARPLCPSPTSPTTPHVQPRRIRFTPHSQPLHTQTPLIHPTCTPRTPLVHTHPVPRCSPKTTARRTSAQYGLRATWESPLFLNGHPDLARAASPSDLCQEGPSFVAWVHPAPVTYESQCLRVTARSASQQSDGGRYGEGGPANTFLRVTFCPRTRYKRPPAPANTFLRVTFCPHSGLRTVAGALTGLGLQHTEAGQYPKSRVGHLVQHSTAVPRHTRGRQSGGRGVHNRVHVRCMWGGCGASTGFMGGCCMGCT